MAKLWSYCTALFLVLTLAGCGHDIRTDFVGSPSQAPIDTGSECAINDAPVDEPSTPVPGPVAPEPDPEDEYPPSDWGPLKTLRVQGGTRYCKVGPNGEVLSMDSIDVTKGDRLLGIGGGCITRPIREIWAILLNHAYLKPDEVSKYSPLARPDLTDPAHGIYFAFDIESVVRALGGAVTVSWVDRWFHSVTCGTYSDPRQVVINFQKIRGTSHIEFHKESYILDRIAPGITGFAMLQDIKADRTDAKKVRKNIAGRLDALRKGPPDWAALPDLVHEVP